MQPAPLLLPAGEHHAALKEAWKVFAAIESTIPYPHACVCVGNKRSAVGAEPADVSDSSPTLSVSMKA